MKVFNYDTDGEDGPFHCVSLIPLRELGPHKVLKIATGPWSDKTLVTHALGLGICGDEKTKHIWPQCKDFFKLLKKERPQIIDKFLVERQHEEVLKDAEKIRRAALIHYGCIL